jgi:predicted DCC family thiol-disulfide oxidoreductase YuxK
VNKNNSKNESMMTTIIFYDELCGLCQRSVLFFLKNDKKGAFLFAPQGGKTAQEKLQGWQEKHVHVDSLVVLEQKGSEQHIYTYSQAVLCLLWHLGGFYRILGSAFFLPAFFLKPADWVYSFIAKHRRKICELEERKELFKDYKSRFLP